MASDEPKSGWLFFAYRPYSGFLMRALGRCDREPQFSGTILSTGQNVEWTYRFSISSTAETWEEREKRRLRDVALGFSDDCEFNTPIAEDEILISSADTILTQFRFPVVGKLHSLSIVHLAPFQYCILWDRLQREDHVFHLPRRAREDSLTADQKIELAETLEIQAGDYLTIALGHNGPHACLAIRKLLTNGQFEGEIFTTAELAAGVIDIYSDETGKINWVPTRIASRIGHLELAK